MNRNFFANFLFSIVLVIGVLFAPSSQANMVVGDSNAKITVKVFSSLTCPHCANFHKKIFEELNAEFIEKKLVKFEHHAFPLDLAALNAEKLLRCTSEPLRRFDLLKVIYDKQNNWAVGNDINKINANLLKLGTDFGIEKNIVEKCFVDKEMEKLILTERIESQKKYNISSTPTIFINEKKYEGTHDYKQFKKELEKNL